ncbi:MAG: metal ABC transporter substrate-binding protein [Trueperaceae bacterium]
MLVALAASFAFAFIGTPVFAQDGDPDDAPLRVVVSIHPYADLARQIVGDAAEVVTLLPAGASPHAYDPSPSQATALAHADVVVMNGGIDAWLARLVEATAPAAEHLVILETIAFTPVEEHEDHDGEPETDPADTEDAPGAEEAEGHDGEATVGIDLLFVNPHVWLDPTLAARAVTAMGETFARAAPARAETFRANAEALVAELIALDAELAAILAPAKGAPFVPFHDAWPYFAQRYGLEVVVTLEPFPGREPSPRYVAEAVALVRAAGALAVFGERQLNPRPAEVVAESAGVRLVILDPIGGAPGPERYQDLMRENARKIVEALAPSTPEGP